MNSKGQKFEKQQAEKAKLQICPYPEGFHSVQG
jgi:hypothetical protein